MEKILSKNFFNAEAAKLSFFEGNGGYEILKKTFKMKPAEVTDLVKASGLRGRGGAGFSTGTKWTFVPKETKKPVYLCINCDESEPGTFKDREIVTWDPHLLIEGIVIAAYALNSHQSYIYFRGEYKYEAEIFRKAVEEAYAKNYLGKNIQGSGFDLELVIHMGAGAYICGEETALIESLEGKRGYPRLKPPFPAVEGLFQSPTIVNNVETLANLGAIVRNGADWFKQWGTPKASGTRLFAVSGHVQKPGTYECPVDVNLLELIELAGGLFPGRKLKAVIPGGASAPVMKADECNTSMDFDNLAAIGTMAGSGGVVVMDDTTDMVSALRTLTDFFGHESCGQCTPCREGSGWIAKVVRNIEAGNGSPKDLDMLMDVCDNMKGRTVCVLSDAIAGPVESFIKKFREEFLSKMKIQTTIVSVSSSMQSLPVIS